MPSILISLNISPDALLRYYQGEAQLVLATAQDGRKVQFPAHVLRAHVRHDGVIGDFLLVYDEQNRFVTLQRRGP